MGNGNPESRSPRERGGKPPTCDKTARPPTSEPEIASTHRRLPPCCCIHLTSLGPGFLKFDTKKSFPCRGPKNVWPYCSIYPLPLRGRVRQPGNPVSPATSLNRCANPCTPYQLRPN